jgi:hypothetical protein
MMTQPMTLVIIVKGNLFTNFNGFQNQKIIPLLIEKQFSIVLTRMIETTKISDTNTHKESSGDSKISPADNKRTEKTPRPCILL